MNLLKVKLLISNFKEKVFFSASKMVDKIICKVYIPVVKSCYLE